jgi:hypothetical protein
MRFNLDRIVAVYFVALEAGDGGRRTREAHSIEQFAHAALKPDLFNDIAGFGDRSPGRRGEGIGVRPFLHHLDHFFNCRLVLHNLMVEIGLNWLG